MSFESGTYYSETLNTTPNATNAASGSLEVLETKPTIDKQSVLLCKSLSRNSLKVIMQECFTTDSHKSLIYPLPLKWNDENGTYVDDNAEVSYNSLKLHMRYIDDTPTSIKLASNLVFQYGALEAKLKFSKTRYVVNAFWILPFGSLWPDGGEIEIIEQFTEVCNNQPFLQLYDKIVILPKGTTINSIQGFTDIEFNEPVIRLGHYGAYLEEEYFDPSDDFHVYRFEKRPNNIKVFIDNILQVEYSNVFGNTLMNIVNTDRTPFTSTRNKGNFSWPYDKGLEYSFLLSQYLGGQWYTPPTAVPGKDELPTYSEYKYIKFEELDNIPSGARYLTDPEQLQFQQQLAQRCNKKLLKQQCMYIYKKHGVPQQPYCHFQEPSLFP